MLETMWSIFKAAVLSAAKDKVSEMTKDEAKEIIDKIGVKVEEVTDEIAEKVAEFKAGLDTETRRTLRKFWLVIVGVSFCLGALVGYFIA